VDNPVVARLSGGTDPAIVQRGVALLYVQALILGHRPLSGAELTLLTETIDSVIAADVERLPRIAPGDVRDRVLN
jgi:molecular chaperone HtpG